MSKLIRVNLRNFLSLDDVEFDLDGRDGPCGFALVYGENGSGKTNLVRSMRFLHDSAGTIILADAMDALRAETDRKGLPKITEDGQDSEEPTSHMMKGLLESVPTSLTKLGRSCRMIGSEDPMALEYEFESRGIRLWYGMMFDRDGMLVREELRRLTAGTRSVRVFLVESSSEGTEAVFGRSVFSAELSRAVRRRLMATWGTNSLLAIVMSERMRNNPGYTDSSMSEDVGAAIDFTGDIVTDVAPGGSVWPNGLSIESGIADRRMEPFLRPYGEAASGYLVRLYSDIKGAEYRTEVMDDRLRYELVVHRMIAGKVREIPISRESAGTRKLLGMLPALLKCTTGKVAVIDEFDSGVHDKMVHDVLSDITREIDGQLILTTHNTLLLETAEPSGVFVIRTDVDGRKEIRTFDSIARTKKGHHNNRLRYLNGLYDGIPMIRRLDLQSMAKDLEDGIGRLG